jgi:hypothetical protein
VEARRRWSGAGRTAPLALLALVAVAIPCGGCGGDIKPDELSRSIDTLISSASEGRLLAQGVAEDRTKATFVRVRARELTELTDHEGEKLNDASSTAALAADKRAAVALSGRISNALGDLQTSPTEPAIAERAEHELGRLASRGERLQDSL